MQKIKDEGYHEDDQDKFISLFKKLERYLELQLEIQ